MISRTVPKRVLIETSKTPAADMGTFLRTFEIPSAGRIGDNEFG
jgi:hypothetical protein